MSLKPRYMLQQGNGQASIVDVEAGAPVLTLPAGAAAAAALQVLNEAQARVDTLTETIEVMRQAAEATSQLTYFELAQLTRLTGRHICRLERNAGRAGLTKPIEKHLRWQLRNLQTARRKLLRARARAA